MLNEQYSPASLFSMIDSAFDEYSGMIIVDKKGNIIYTSPRFSEYLFGICSNEVIGENIEEIIPESGIIEVLLTGIPQIARIWQINDQKIIVSRFPIKKKGQIIGAISIIIFRRVVEAMDLAHQLLGNYEELDYYKEEVKRLWGAKYSFDSIIGNSLAIMEARRKAWDIAITHSPVLITGETGTGKELFAHAIHQDSPHKDGPFIALNCAGIPDNLVESELFGYEQGAFTGARNDGKPGKFELANTGTIFLDEISELPKYTQAKLLRILQEKEVERIGGTSVIPINVRVISATNRDLEVMIKEGEFREDLYYRLNVFSVKIPPLRERIEDISTISYHFISLFNREVGTKVSGLSDEALHMMRKYTWPGNIRELKSTIERACLDTKMGLIRPESLYYIKDRIDRAPDSKEDDNLSLKEIRMKAEKKAIVRVLEKTGGNKTLACKMLGVNRTSFYNKLKELNIEDYS